MDVDLLVLNYNGRALLEECLPSIVAAAARSRHACRVTVVDNGSSDDSLDWLEANHPLVSIARCANEGLCSFNRVLAESSAPVAILLNNDIRLDENAVDPLVEPLAADQDCRRTRSDSPPSPGDAAEPCFLAAPLCWQWDGQTLEGFKTAVRWRWGVVQATGRFPGAPGVCRQAGETAAAGAAHAVDRNRFLELGGFDPIYLPGRIEDLDFAYRGYLAGYRAAYVPQAVAWHRGAASFGPEFGEAGCLHLALRNTLLFQWRHLRHPLHLARQAVGIPLRLCADLGRAPFTPANRRFLFTRAFLEALGKRRESDVTRPAATTKTQTARRRERDYFLRFHPQALVTSAAPNSSHNELQRAADEASRNGRHPVSRWYLLPLLDRIVPLLASSALRPWHFTVLGLLLTMAAACVLVFGGATAAWIAAPLVWSAWACDRIDGKLARGQGTASRWGAWFDANVDELCDLALHAAIAWAVSAAALAHGIPSGPATAPSDIVLPILLPWGLLSAFLIGKYLMVFGQNFGPPTPTLPRTALARPSLGSAGGGGEAHRLLKALYHLPGNADVRLHVVVIALAGGWLTAALVYAAVYFNVRWVFTAARLFRQSLQSVSTSLDSQSAAAGPWADSSQASQEPAALRGFEVSAVARKIRPLRSAAGGLP